MSLGLGRLFQNSMKIVAGLGTPFSRNIHHITGFNPSSGLGNTLSIVQNASALSAEAASPQMTAGGAWSLITTRFRRTTVYKNERKRLITYSWKARMSTEKGRLIIMKRILKGRYYLTH